MVENRKVLFSLEPGGTRGPRERDLSSCNKALLRLVPLSWKRMRQPCQAVRSPSQSLQQGPDASGDLFRGYGPSVLGASVLVKGPFRLLFSNSAEERGSPTPRGPRSC